MERGAARKWAVMVGNTRKGAWLLSKNGTVCAALPDDWFTRSAGVLLLGSFWAPSVNNSRTANYAIRMISGVGGTLRKEGSHPDRLCIVSGHEVTVIVF